VALWRFWVRIILLFKHWSWPSIMNMHFKYSCILTHGIIEIFHMPY
jgi:hypothetical protein